MGTQETENHSTCPSPSLFSPGGVQTGTPMSDCVLPSLSSLPSVRQTHRQTIDGFSYLVIHQFDFPFFLQTNTFFWDIRLDSFSLYIPAWSQTHDSSCFSLHDTGIAIMYHHICIPNRISQAILTDLTRQSLML